MKKVILIFLCAIMLAGCTGGNARNYNVIIDPADKVIMSEQFVSKFYPASMETNLRFSELVIDGTITGTYEKTLSTGQMYTEEEIAMGFPSAINYTFSVFKITEAVRGDIDGKEVLSEDEIYVLFSSPMTLPYEGENVILFVSSRLIDGFLFYVPIDGEHSIFTYEDGRRERLYSFSNSEELSAFDGRHKDELYEVVRESEDFFKEGNPYREDRVN